MQTPVTIRHFDLPLCLMTMFTTGLCCDCDGMAYRLDCDLLCHVQVKSDEELPPYLAKFADDFSILAADVLYFEGQIDPLVSWRARIMCNLAKR